MYHVQNQIMARHDRLKAFWEEVWQERSQENEAHKSALAAGKARSAPGSQAGGGACRRALGPARSHGGGDAGGGQGGDAGGKTRALADDAKALRNAVAPIDAGLPPADTGKA